MLDDKEKLLKKNRLFTIRKNKKALTAYEKAKRFYFAFSVLFSFALVCAFYFTSDFSKIYRITVSGNEYLKSEEIIAQSGLSEDSSFLLMLPWRAEKKIRENHLIDTVKVKRLPGRLVEIEVSEKKIVGYAPENGLNVLILEDGERLGVTRQDMYLIANAPIIQGFDEEELSTLIRWLSRCERKIIKEISEIHNYPQLKYQNVELIMRDGNYVFSSVFGLEILNHYFDMESSFVTPEYHCYYFEDISGNAYTSACPWEEVEEEPKEPAEEIEEE